MLAFGGLLTCAALLALAGCALLFRRPGAPRWTTYSICHELVAIAIVCVLAIGLGYLAAGVIGALEHGVDFMDVALLTGILLATFVILRRLRVFERVRAYEAVSAGTGRKHVHPPASPSQPSSPTHRAA
jgi:hypothetical protein